MKNIDFIISQAKRYKTYLFYKRHPWIQHIPFWQIKYWWVMALWDGCIDDVIMASKIQKQIEKYEYRVRKNARRTS